MTWSTLYTAQETTLSFDILIFILTENKPLKGVTWDGWHTIPGQKRGWWRILYRVTCDFMISDVSLFLASSFVSKLDLLLPHGCVLCCVSGITWTECGPHGHYLRPLEPNPWGASSVPARSILPQDWPRPLRPRGSGAQPTNCFPLSYVTAIGSCNAAKRALRRSLVKTRSAFLVKPCTYYLVTQPIRMCEALLALLHSIGQTGRVQDPQVPVSEDGYP